VGNLGQTFAKEVVDEIADNDNPPAIGTGAAADTAESLRKILCSRNLQ